MISNFITSFTSRKRVTILSLIISTLLGLFAYISIPKEDAPDIKIPMIYVRVPYPGISVHDSHKLLLKPIEIALRSTEGVKQIKSYAFDGSAVILVEFYAGFNSEKALSDVRAKVNDNEYKLPHGAKKPTIHEINLSLFPVLNVILTGSVSDEEMIRVARDLKEKIESIKDVLDVNLRGDKEDVVEVILKQDLIKHHKLSLSLIEQSIKKNNDLITLGSISQNGGTFAVRLYNKIESPNDLNNLPIITRDNTTIKLGDIADIKQSFKDPKFIATANGQNVVVLEVSKRIGANIISTIEEVKSLVKEEKESFPKNLEVIYSQDKSEKIIDMIRELENGVILAVILVVLVIIFSIGLRTALLVALSIPASFLVGVLFLDLSGYTLNIVVLFSLILTVGMIVDDAIIVSEYADRKIAEGRDVQKSFVEAASRMFWPIITSTAVKIVVFLPLLFWPGVVGQFMKYMPITVVCILTNSLLFALIFQPSIGSLFGKPKGHDIKIINSIKASETGNVENLVGLTKKYYILLEKVLKKPKQFIAFSLCVFVGVYVFFGIKGTGVEFFPNIEPDSGVLVVKTKGNLSVWQKHNIIQAVQNRILDMKDEVKVFYAKSGSFKDQSSYPKSTIGSIELELKDWKKRRKAHEIFDEVKKRINDIDGIDTEILYNKGGPSSLRPIEINFFSKNLKKANQFAEKLIKHMEQIGGYKDITTNASLPGIEWDVVLNKELASLYNLNPSDIGSSLSLITDGYKVSTFHPEYTDDEVDIMLKLPEEQRKISNINNLDIINAKGDAIPISNVTKKISVDKLDTISRLNGKDLVSLSCDVKKGVLANDKIRELKLWLSKNIDEGVSYEFKGQDEDSKESGNFLAKAFMLALVMMFIIMLIQFNSFYHTIVVMSAVFLSTVGVLIGLVLTWQPFGIVMCGIGIIALSGIVLNNNILFIDTYQHLRKSNISIDKAIILAGIQRMRPILLTASTAILGLLPMVIGLTIDLFHMEFSINSPSSQWWKQLSASIVGGLSFATILTLFFTPCLLKIGAKLDPFIKKENEC